MVLGNKLLTAGTHFAPSVKSIIGHVSCLGWVFIESNGANASKLCVNVSDVYPRHIHPIVEDLQQYLHEPLVAPKEGDWVRLTSPPLYRGDLAYVHAYNNTSSDRLTTKRKNPGGEGADILVVPWVERFANRTKSKGRAGRPPPQFLERKEAIRLFGAAAIIAHDEDELIFTYRGQKYGDRLHYLVTHEFEHTVPTHEELALFQRRSFVDPVDIARATNEIAALSLHVTDRVVITSGELITMTGIITEFSGNDKEATICLDSTEITMDVVLSPNLLRKFTVNVNRVAFHHDAQALSWVSPKQDVSWKPFEENPHPPPRRNFVYLGRCVMVIKRGNHYTTAKSYEGIIREILLNDEVRVELSATLKRKTFHLSQLSNLNDEKCKPLVYKYYADTFQSDMPLPAQPVLIPQSLVPLTPSTPCGIKYVYGPCMESFVENTGSLPAIS
ncbi:hypothetical protein DXG01_010347 [Tephrocybe rancida]|nr:hypothetical protein DXG01_010347 [Tephrocybe rancida]